MRLSLALLCVCAFLSGLSRTADTPPPSIGAPVDSLKASELHDSFNEIHHGHRHEAIDIMRPRGTPILAVADGSIRKLFLSVQGGITIYEFDSTGTYCFYYAHLGQYAAGLHEGMPVSRGDVIGYVGTTGDAAPDAPQLHFAIYRLSPDKSWWKGEPINPYPILLRAIAGNSVWVLQDLGCPYGANTFSKAASDARFSASCFSRMARAVPLKPGMAF
jgi:peptidoglycan LD-endopeptidase LytH